ncbi:Rad2 nuclease [Sporothrix stenoceras]|uniref:Rad2 nuclease n=1 Tax=Sporothrix stenoceras TaxID=5173 RepID=A0ABR3YTF0_9PEZI
MGITGLLPLLKSIQRPIELKKYAGETFAVDAYGWLHRGAISCALELAQGRPTRKYVDSVLNRVRMVQHFGVTPYLVFDGDFLPSKASTESSRAKRREESRKAGQELMNAGNPKQAFLEFQKAIDITPEMACHLIEELKKLGLPYVVAPYEADAQMVYLEREGLVSGIISEDSDLLVFGAKRLLTKLDMQGHCIEINRREFCACREVSLTDFSDKDFRHMAILSGCDYLEGIGNIGLKTAYRMIRKHKTIEKVVRMLQFDGKYKVSENYMAAFRQAELTFLHQRVFCPVKQELVLLSEPTNGIDVEEMRFIGHKIDHDIARGVAVGSLNPMTKEPIVLPLSPGKKRRASSVTGPNTSPFTPAFSNTTNPEPFGKPINEYFAKRRESAQRIPLGAMDPNCFSVDKQQVAALTQNGLTPRVFPLPRPYVEGGRTSLPLVDVSRNTPATTDSPRLRRRQTEPLSTLLQLGSSPAIPATNTNRQTTTTSMLPPQPRSMSFSQGHRSQGSIASSSRPQKKARLNHVEIEPTNPTTQSLERSKYFTATSTTIPASPPVKKSTRPTELFFMSDDSVEEAMLSLPDIDDWNMVMSNKSTKSTVHVFEDTESTEVCDFVPGSDGIEVPASPANQRSQQKKSASKTQEATPATRLSLGRFSYAGGAKTVHGLPTPDSSFVESQEKSATKPNILTPPSSISQRQARQRPAKAPRMSLGELVESTSVARPEQPRASTKKIRRSVGAPVPVNPSFVPLPPADLDEVAALNRPQGSEDQIVPDSDAEDDDGDLAEQPGSDALGGRLDLSRFMCA